MVNHLYNGKPVTPQHLKNYKLWSSSTLLDDDEKERLLWLNAPVICKTNRERHSISYLRAKQFAKATGTTIIKWRSEYTKWEGKPQDERNIKQAQKDPALFEYFVYNANIILNDTISKSKLLCNGTHGKCHSLVLTDEDTKWLENEMKSSPEEILLPNPPIAINILIEDPKIVKNKNINWKQFSLEKKRL